MIKANKGKVSIKNSDAAETLAEFSLIARGVRELLIREFGTMDADYLILEAISASKLSDRELIHESRTLASELTTNNLS